MTDPIRGLSSMATRALLAALSEASPQPVHFESKGGSQVADDIRAGARADIVVLGREQLAGLGTDGFLEDGTQQPLFVSDVVAAVPATAAPVTLSTEADLKAALTGSGRIAYSTGPSGTALTELLERWRLIEAVQHRLVLAPPGTPVGSLLADGRADLGFQQASELSGVTGVRVLGPLPGSAAIRSTFSGAVLARSTSKPSARQVLQFFTSTGAGKHVVAAGMTVA